jgi:hypothetical protein
MYNPPPAALNDREILIHTASDSEIWYRSHHTNSGPVYFGKSKTQRWDAPGGEYGVLYLGADPYCAFMKSIGRGALKTRFVPRAQLTLRGLTKIRFKRGLRLVDMVGSGGLTRLGCQGSLATGAGYRNSQRWSRALKSHPARPDGIYYRSRYDQARTACALFDSCAPLIQVVMKCGPWAEQPALLGEILDHYRFGTDL